MFMSPSVPAFCAAVKGQQERPAVTAGESLNVRISVIPKHVASTVENHPDSLDRSRAISQCDLVATVRREVLIGQRRNRALKNHTLQRQPCADRQGLPRLQRIEETQEIAFASIATLFFVCGRCK